VILFANLFSIARNVIPILVNYPPTPKAMGWASGFIALCFFAEVLFIAPPVFSTVPAEFNIFNPSFRMLVFVAYIPST
jgi:uncharacterized RDD family membrane protein YckC